MRTFHYKELHNLNYLLNRITIIKCKVMTWIRHIACIGESEIRTTFLPRSCEENIPLRRPRRRCRMILKWISETYFVSV
jgi:hypothetical protein